MWRYRYSDELYHHGVQGQKWGVRRFQNYDGSLILKKGTVVKRISTRSEETEPSNKKYVSINQKDHSKWETHLGEAYIQRYQTTFSQTYITNKDLKVMSSAQQGELYAKMLLDKRFESQAIKDTDEANNSLYRNPEKYRSNDLAENISRNIAAQTKTGKAFVDEVLKNNYDAIFDTHGTNVSENPVIVLNPNNNLSKYAEPEYTKPVKDYLKKYGIAA